MIYSKRGTKLRSFLKTHPLLPAMKKKKMIQNSSKYKWHSFQFITHLKYMGHPFFFNNTLTILDTWSKSRFKLRSRNKEKRSVRWYNAFIWNSFSTILNYNSFFTLFYTSKKNWLKMQTKYSLVSNKDWKKILAEFTILLDSKFESSISQKQFHFFMPNRDWVVPNYLRSLVFSKKFGSTPFYQNFFKAQYTDLAEEEWLTLIPKQKFIEFTPLIYKKLRAEQPRHRSLLFNFNNYQIVKFSDFYEEIFFLEAKQEILLLNLCKIEFNSIKPLQISLESEFKPQMSFPLSLKPLTLVD